MPIQVAPEGLANSVGECQEEVKIPLRCSADRQPRCRRHDVFQPRPHSLFRLTTAPFPSRYQQSSPLPPKKPLGKLSFPANPLPPRSVSSGLVVPIRLARFTHAKKRIRDSIDDHRLFAKSPPALSSNARDRPATTPGRKNIIINFFWIYLYSPVSWECWIRAPSVRSG